MPKKCFVFCKNTTKDPPRHNSDDEIQSSAMLL